MERWDELWPEGWRFCFEEGVFLPSTDTFLLGGFAAPRKNDRVCDLGAGMGLLGLLLLARQPTICVTDVDIDPAACALAEKSFAANGLDGHRVLCGDLRDRAALPTAGSFDMVVSNPPYFDVTRGAVAAGQRGSARAEVCCTLEDVCGAAAYLLRSGGQFCLVHRAERLAEVMALTTRLRLEPKELQLVQKRPDTPPRLALLRCRKDGGAGLTIRPPLVTQDERGGESPALARCYFRDRE